MKIDYSIHSSDSNSFYLDFWPLVSKVWKLKFNVEPILIYIDKNQDIEIDETYGTVIRIKEIDGIPNYLQNLWVRYWYPINFPDKVSIISDIDMFPLSEEYFIDSIKSISDDKYVHLNPATDKLPHPLSLPSCYHVAKGSKFQEVLKLPNNWEDSISELYKTGLGSDHGGHLSGKDRWAADERYATIKINNYENPNDVVLINRRDGQSAHRIDRYDWSYSVENFKNYIDSHSVRPYATYKKEIDFLLEKILEK
jgi:hypothetical protein